MGRAFRRCITKSLRLTGEQWAKFEKLLHGVGSRYNFTDVAVEALDLLCELRGIRSPGVAADNRLKNWFDQFKDEAVLETGEGEQLGIDQAGEQLGIDQAAAAPPIGDQAAAPAKARCTSPAKKASKSKPAPAAVKSRLEKFAAEINGHKPAPRPAKGSKRKVVKNEK